MADMPSRIGNFEVLSQIGSGGMGTVYLGRDPGLGRQVAIKVIREEVRDKEVLDRFFREARAAAALRHPNIITVYTSGQHEYQPYMVMEFVDGESLAEIIRSRRTLPLSDKMSYLEQICAGLHFAHRAGIVHRDIKPANIMIDREGVVRILDFGIARIEGSAMTQDGSLMGSLNTCPRSRCSGALPIIEAISFRWARWPTNCSATSRRSREGSTTGCCTGCRTRPRPLCPRSIPGYRQRSNRW